MTDLQPEQRRHVRKRLDCTVPAIRTDNGQPLGYLADISKEGFKVICPVPLERESQLDLILELPNADSVRQIEVTAECRWCLPAEESEEFGAGFHIKSISDQNQVALNYFIRDFEY
ncbi:PilZ domain-containing protein [Sansalvadorimonas sp. 2012CJ34-2]|uniref:PilZ domain-containing protein n=1 Tax=Parendozoicomonas callyspongiae TaxID=2942213 RepID=A0ABT0PEF3_9GAMM|nr:PilZ domain-containing protein [Sansalvadorimonas sp. 2012CJ34-2]MCL6269762.1 PilZ domain-containing protein [Sansalvadorimonas sp. 2012CJ34-2]